MATLSPAELAFADQNFVALKSGRTAEHFLMSGPRNPYPGELGVVKEGALADLRLVDGNVLATIHLLDDPEKVIMEDVKIYKNPPSGERFRSEVRVTTCA